jgi:Protein of unknown function (DUF3298)/Deacetylase PdaC
MKQTLNLFSCLLLLLILGACKPEKKIEEKDLGQTALSNDLYAYVQLRGELGDKKATLHLIQDRSYEDLAYYHGSLVYDDTNIPVSIFGGADTTGTVNLNLIAYTQEELPTLAGKFVNNGFEGEFFDPASKKKAPFRFELSSEGVQFKGTVMTDTMQGKTIGEQTGRGKISFEYLTAKNFTFLNDLIIKDFEGESGKNPAGNIRAIYTAERDSFFDTYKRDVNEYGVDGESGFMVMNYEEESSMEVLFNSPTLLSLAYTHFSYMGGAHGNYGSRCASYDLKKQKKITLEDLFKPGYEKFLGDELTKVAEKQFNTDNLESTLFVKKVEPNDNFFITPKGICFNYVPYEIAAYALGEIKLFVPFENLKAISK